MNVIDYLTRYRDASRNARHAMRRYSRHGGESWIDSATCWYRMAALWAGLLAAELGIIARSNQYLAPAYIGKARYYRNVCARLEREWYNR